MTNEEIKAIEAQVAEEKAQAEKLIPYEGLRAQVAFVLLDNAIETITKECYADDGETPMILRTAYKDVIKELQAVKSRLFKVCTLDAQRQIPCYTIEDGKLVRMKLDTLLVKLQEINGQI